MLNKPIDSLEKPSDNPINKPLPISIANVIYDIPQFQIQNVFLLENKKNMIMDGNFTKIIYSDDAFILYGIFLNVPLLIDGFSTNGISGNKYFFKFQPNHIANEHIVNNLINIEYRILEFYKSIFRVNKKITTVLRNQLYNGYIKIYTSSHFLHRPASSNSSEEASSQPMGGKPVSLRSSVMDNVYPIKKTFLIKISGVWEDAESIGLTYKFEFLSGKNLNVL